MKDYLPVGSVVELDSLDRKAVIMGIMPQLADKAYDYIAVPYPEGYIGQENLLVFNQEKIKEVVFTGYSNAERDGFLLFVDCLIELPEEAPQTFKEIVYSIPSEPIEQQEIPLNIVPGSLEELQDEEE